MKKDVEFLMVNAASLALEYKAKHPSALEEEILKYVLNYLEVKPELKIVSVASANEVLKIQKMSKTLSDKEIMQAFMNNLPKLVASLVEEEEKEGF